MTLGRFTKNDVLIVGNTSQFLSGFKGTYKDSSYQSTGYDVPDIKYYDEIIYDENCLNPKYIGQLFCHTKTWFTIYGNTNEEGPFVSIVGANHNAIYPQSQFSAWGGAGTNRIGEGTFRSVIALEK